MKAQCRLPLDVEIIIQEARDDMMAREATLREARDDFERRLIRVTLAKVNWNQTRAAAFLGLHRNTLYGKARSLGILS
ncbi:hypothetical protein KAU86_05665 [bacterium]|nr:hypothetical protein [bacterium]MCK4437413.1 hypothetical protein [bacterium]